MAIVYSAAGGETLVGTSGADTFVYNAVADSTTTSFDNLTFSREWGDKIDLSAVPLTGTNPPEKLHWAGIDATGTAKQWGVWQWGDSTHAIRIDTDGDGLANMSIEIVGGPLMQASDFIGLAETPPSPVGDPRVFVRFPSGTLDTLVAAALIEGLLPSIWSPAAPEDTPEPNPAQTNVSPFGSVNLFYQDVVGILVGAGVPLVEFLRQDNNSPLIHGTPVSFVASKVKRVFQTTLGIRVETDTKFGTVYVQGTVEEVVEALGITVANP